MFKKGMSCSKCKFNKKFYNDDGQRFREEIQQECSGRVLDLIDLQELAFRYDSCVSAISKILAKPEKDGIKVFAVAPYAYLIQRLNRRLIEEVNPDYIFVDEGDLLVDTMLGHYQRSLLVASSRSRVDRIYSMACGLACDKCHLHFSDSFTNRIRPCQRLEGPSAYGRVGKPENFLEYMEGCVRQVEEMVKSGLVIGAFDFDAIRHNLDRIGKVLSVEEGQCPYKCLESIQAKLIESAPEGVRLDCLYEGVSYEVYDETTGNKIKKIIRPAVNVAKIDVERVVTEDGWKELKLPEWAGDPDVTPDEAALLDEMLPEDGNISLADVCSDGRVMLLLKGTENENSLKGFLELVNFVDGAPKKECEERIGVIEMYFEMPHIEDASDEMEEQMDESQTVKRAGVDCCAIRLRYLDVDGYKSAIKFLQNRKTMMLSGTFLSQERIAETLLLHPDEVNYVDARVAMHDAALIIHHNPKMGKLIRGITGISLGGFGDCQVLEFYNMIAELRDETKVLHYAVNTRRGNTLYHIVENNQHLNGRFYVQNECPQKTQIPDWCSPEQTPLRKSDWLFFDKVRSSTSRAVDREQFHLLSVHGNCYADWYDMLPLVGAIREYVNEDVDLEKVIEYNRQRAVFQTLLRNHRNEHRHVSIYLSGDMHYTSYPNYLRRRVVESHALMRKLSEMYPEKFLSNIQVQMEMLARVIDAFLEKRLNDIDAFLSAEVTDPDNPPEILKVVFGDFEFQGEYGKGEKSQKVGFSWGDITDDREKYLIESFVDEYCGNTDHSRTYKTAIVRLEHVKKCVLDKGYVEKEADLKGKRDVWRVWLNHLVAKKYLVEALIKTGSRPKTVYKADVPA